MLRAQQQERLGVAAAAATTTSPLSSSMASATQLRRRIEERHPHTPYDEVVRLAAAATATTTTTAASTRVEGSRDGAVATHRGGGAAVAANDHITRNEDKDEDDDEDEEAVWRLYGMGAFVAPHVVGFDGHFRQQWRDFHVTEMVRDVDEPTCGGRPVSRALCFDIPPPPPWLLLPSLQQEQPSSQTSPQQEHDASEERRRVTQSFFEVDVEAAVARHLREDDGGDAEGEGGGGARAAQPPPSSPPTDNKSDAASNSSCNSSSQFYLECTMHKCHVAHGVALARLAQVLRLHPRAISVSGIKDFVGDTVQRIRLRNVSPLSALRANVELRGNKQCGDDDEGKRDDDGDGGVTLSDFAYARAPLSTGDHFGNHFVIVLRGVTAPRAVVRDALDAFAQHGFANYYGCQRFSWFGGRDDAAWALVRHHWLAFAFRFLNYTADPSLTLRALLQRPNKYPLPLQDEYRRRVVRRLRHIGVSPDDLDVAPFLSAPSLADTSLLLRPGGEVSSGIGVATAAAGLTARQCRIVTQLRGAYFDLAPASRRLLAQRLSSFLWNQVLTMRLRDHHRRRRSHNDVDMPVLCGDWVASAEVRQLARDADERAAWSTAHRHLATAAEARGRHIRDVVHPGFSFEGGALPRNDVAAYYARVCARYHLDWQTRHARVGLRDFCEPPRPIVRHPLGLTHDYDEAASTLTVRFALERGCYANVAVTELLKAARCVGADAVVSLPLPASQWAALGHRDRGRVLSFRDVYEGFVDGVGFWDEQAEPPPPPPEQATTARVWEHDGPLFLPPDRDPCVIAARWSKTHLLRNMRRRIADEARARAALFEEPLAQRVRDEEVARYAGHGVPLSPNMSGGRVKHKLLRRKRRYQGAPATTAYMRRGAALPASSQRRRKRGGGDTAAPAPFCVLSTNAWNVTW